MKTANSVPFRSEFGFSSPSLLIDENGNITANSATFITVTFNTATFNELDILSTQDTTGSETGALRVAGGVSIEKNLFIGNSLISDTEIKLSITNSGVIATIDATGLTAPIKDSTINNTPIGNITPASGIFTSAKVTSSPTVLTDVTNKNYVDNTVAVLSIALGM